MNNCKQVTWNLNNRVPLSPFPESSPIFRMVLKSLNHVNHGQGASMNDIFEDVTEHYDISVDKVQLASVVKKYLFKALRMQLACARCVRGTYYFYPRPPRCLNRCHRSGKAEVCHREEEMSYDENDGSETDCQDERICQEGNVARYRSVRQPPRQLAFRRSPKSIRRIAVRNVNSQSTSRLTQEHSAEIRQPPDSVSASSWKCGEPIGT